MTRSNSLLSAPVQAEWLSELARAIDDAQWLAWRLGVIEGKSEALDLYVRLEVARAEAEALRRSVGSGRNP